MRNKNIYDILLNELRNKLLKKWFQSLLDLNNKRILWLKKWNLIILKKKTADDIKGNVNFDKSFVGDDGNNAELNNAELDNIESSEIFSDDELVQEQNMENQKIPEGLRKKVSEALKKTKMKFVGIPTVSAMLALGFYSIKWSRSI